MTNLEVFLFFLLQVVIVSGWQPNEGIAMSRMYGSQFARDGQFPYVTFHVLEVKGGYDTCTGCIIGKWWVLLAAHCITPGQDPKEHVVVAGKVNVSDYMYVRLRNMPLSINIDERKYDLQERRAAALFQHPNYTPPGQHDFGLVKLEKPFKFTNRIRAVPLPKGSFTPQTNCIVAGFGHMEGNKQRYHLQYIADMSAKPSRLCKYATRNNDAICLGEISRGICRGDSGGPLICGGKIVGVASYIASSDPNCGVGTHEQYYTDVGISKSWIIHTKNANRPLK